MTRFETAARLSFYFVDFVSELSKVSALKEQCVQNVITKWF